VFFGLFFISLFGGRKTSEGSTLEIAYRAAAKSTCLAWLIADTVSGALPDLGLPFFVFAAFASAKTIQPLKENKRNSELLVI
jgi:hypothetical protein